MKIEIDLPDSIISDAVREAVKRNHIQWRGNLDTRVIKEIDKALAEIDLTVLAKECVACLVHEVLEDQVRTRLRYIVKLAVDNELATARAAEQIKAETGKQGDKL